MSGYWKWMMMAGAALVILALSGYMPPELGILSFIINTLGFSYLAAEACETEALRAERQFKMALFRMEWSAEAEGGDLSSTEASLLRGWREAQDGRVRPIEELWDGLDADDLMMR